MTVFDKIIDAINTVKINIKSDVITNEKTITVHFLDPITKEPKTLTKEVRLSLLFGGSYDGNFTNLKALKEQKEFFKRYASVDSDYLELDRQKYTSKEYSKDFEEFRKYHNGEAKKESMEEFRKELYQFIVNKLALFKTITFIEFNQVMSDKNYNNEQRIDVFCELLKRKNIIDSKTSDGQRLSKEIDNSFKRLKIPVLEYLQKGAEEKFLGQDWKTYKNIANTNIKEDTYIKEIKRIPFYEFKRVVLPVFSAIVFHEIENNPEYLLYMNDVDQNAKELVIELKIVRAEDREFYFFYQYHSSDYRTICFYCSGTWLIHAIVAPYFYYKKINQANIAYCQKMLLHEFTHHLDFVKEQLLWDTKFKEVVERNIKKTGLNGLSFVYLSLFNLREEGIADFSARKYSREFKIEMSGVKEYHRKLEELSKIKSYTAGENYHDSKISTGNMGPSGEYTIGRNMCLIIAMSIAKTNQSKYSIIDPRGEVHSGYEFPQLNDWLAENKTITVINMDKSILEEAKNRIGPTRHYRFIKLYEDECDNINISEENRMMTKKRFKELTAEVRKK